MPEPQHGCSSIRLFIRKETFNATTAPFTFSLSALLCPAENAETLLQRAEQPAPASGRPLQAAASFSRTQPGRRRVNQQSDNLIRFTQRHSNIFKGPCLRPPAEVLLTLLPWSCPGPALVTPWNPSPRLTLLSTGISPRPVKCGWSLILWALSAGAELEERFVLSRTAVLRRI